MWQKYYRIAERQLLAGKYKKVEGHAKRALEFAHAANDSEQIAKSLALLSKVYLETDDSRAVETLRESVEGAERAYGSNSPELAEELEILAVALEFQEDLEAAESARLRALSIREACEDCERLLDALDEFVGFCIEQGRFDRAEPHFLRALEIRKRLHGPVSLEVEDEIGIYADILEGLGRADEIAELETISRHCESCGPEDSHSEDDPEVEEILSSVTEPTVRNDLDQCVEALRQAIPRLKELADKQAGTVSESDPFRELKISAKSQPYRWARSSLAQMLRVKADKTGDNELLLEAAQLLREVVQESGVLSAKCHLILTLLDLSQHDGERYAELDQLISATPGCAVSLYTRALAMYRRYGSTPESRAAMTEAVEFNPHVPTALGASSYADMAPKYFSFGDAAEAQLYCRDAGRQWSTPGAIDFMLGVMSRSLPAGVRH